MAPAPYPDSDLDKPKSAYPDPSNTTWNGQPQPTGQTGAYDNNYYYNNNTYDPNANQPGVYQQNQPGAYQPNAYQPNAVPAVPIVVVQPTANQMGYTENPGMFWCAIVGLIFSFIPLVGWINFCVHAGTPRDRPRWKIGVASGIVGTIFFILNIIYILKWRKTE